MRAVIAGAGVGGLTLAGLLLRQGWQVEVHESSPQLRTLGAGFTLWSNATAILQQLGLGEWLQSEGQPIEEGQILNFRRCLVRHPIAQMSLDWGSPTLAVHRGDLLEALADQVPEIRLGSRLTRRPTADLFVAADGIHSAFRSDPLRYSGYLGCWGVAPNPQPQQRSSLWMLGPGATVGRIPLTRGRLFWFATSAMNESEARLKQFRPLRFRGWPKEVVDLLNGLDPASALVTPIYDRKPTRHWGDLESWTLLGDAAHATTPSFGHGACLAIESAWELSQLLRELPVPQALARYEASRQRRTAAIIQSSDQVGRLFHWNPPWSNLRDLCMDLTPVWLHKRALNAIVMGGRSRLPGTQSPSS